MSTDYNAQIQAYIKEISEISSKSISYIHEIEESVSLNSVQVGDYSLPEQSGDPITAISKLEELVSKLSDNLTGLNTSLDLAGIKVPNLPSDIYNVSPEDFLKALKSIDAERVQQPKVYTISPNDLNSIDFCAPVQSPAPSITMEDFLKLCNDIKIEAKPSNISTPSSSTNYDPSNALNDLISVPEYSKDDIKSKNDNMTNVVSAMSGLDVSGGTKDVIVSNLSTTDVGKMLLSSSNINGTKRSDIIPDVINPDDLYKKVKLANLDVLEDPVQSTSEKLNVDCVKLLLPIIDESQKQSSRFAFVKKRLSDIQQEAKIGSLFIDFWKTVYDTVYATDNSKLQELTKNRSELEKQKKELETKLQVGLVNRPGMTVNSLKNPQLLKLEQDISKIESQQKELLKGRGINLTELKSYKNFPAALNPILSELSIDLDIFYEEHNTPRFVYSKEKIFNESDRRLQKLQNALGESIRSIDLSDPKGVDSVQSIHKDFQEKYDKEIERTRVASNALAYKWSLSALVNGGGLLTALLTKSKQRMEEYKNTYEPIVNEYNSLKIEDAQIQKYMDDLPNVINTTLKNGGCDPISLPNPVKGAGWNINYKDIPMDSEESPNIFDIRWWLRFCALASTVNLAPVHWPVGLILPIIPRPLFIPCPIIWSPLAIFNTPVALIVILIGQCGILPSPFVFVLNTATFPLGPLNPRSCWFPVAIRPMCHIKDNPRSERLQTAPMLDVPMVSIPTIQNQISIIREQIDVNLKQIDNNTKLINQFNAENDQAQQIRLVELNNSTKDLLVKNAGLYKQITNLTAVIAQGPSSATIEVDPSITRSMPLYVDDLPTWERLSLSNIPFLSFLWKWCAAGKNGGGFLRDPI